MALRVIQLRVSILPMATQAATVSVPKLLTAAVRMRFERPYIMDWSPEGRPICTVRRRILESGRSLCRSSL